MTDSLTLDHPGAAIGSVVAKTRAALEWYGQEAAAAARHMANKDTNPDALLAILTVLANDGGERADKALKHSSECDHKWVDITNEVVTGGELCLKCHVIRATP